MEAADELGMFIELEMPLCWDRSSDTPQGFLYTIQVHMEAVTFNRHHASVIAWSLANESPWGPTFTTYATISLPSELHSSQEVVTIRPGPSTPTSSASIILDLSCSMAAPARRCACRAGSWTSRVTW